jgi:lysophospholipase L1-like esterase
VEATLRKINCLVLATALLLLSFSRVVAADAPTSRPTIFVCGDSTSKFNGGETMDKLAARGGKPMAGWGTPIIEFFDPAKVAVNNVGHAGTSSMTYYNADWPRVLPQINAGDFVLIVFGINDGGLRTPDGISDEVVQRPVVARGRRGGATQPADAPPQMESVHTYGWYMGKMATDAQAKGARVVFLTVTTRNMWTNPKVKFNDATPATTLPADYDAKDDRIERGTGNNRYGQWTKEVGAKLHIPVFDLTNYCADLYEKMGREETNKLYNDHNHTYLTGAETVAKSIVAGLKAFKDSPFNALLSEKGKEVPAADTKYVSDNLP